MIFNKIDASIVDSARIGDRGKTRLAHLTT
jgi:hypothetical protein